MMAPEALAQSFRGAAKLVLDAVLPPACLSCAAPVGEPGTLCPSCWQAVIFLGPPMCHCCGYPFELEPGGESFCGACLRRTPAYDRARAVAAYDGGSRELLLRFKHADRIDAAPAFAGWMARAGAELLADAEIIAPVPLHRWRLLRRRYNQAALLARLLGRSAGVPVVPDLLVRRRNTVSQGRLSIDGRRRNVAGAFSLRPRRRAWVAHKRVLLIDDVLTTGATVEACARVLRRAGASGVDVLTVARVVRPHG